MTTPSLPARRATIEDLQKLAPLWIQEGLPAEELSKRFQEFQVVDGPDGELVGAIGLQIAGHEGRLHSEAFLHHEEAENIRASLWERVQMISKNHGLVRVWTQLPSPFWHQNGFQDPAPEVATKLPAAFAGNPAPWSFLQLRDEAAMAPSIEKEFAMFREMQKEETDRVFRQARVMKLVAAVILVVVFVLVSIWVFAWFKAQSMPRHK
jgi:hypothetical protein